MYTRNTAKLAGIRAPCPLSIPRRFIDRPLACALAGGPNFGKFIMHNAREPSTEITAPCVAGGSYVRIEPGEMTWPLLVHALGECWGKRTRALLIWISVRGLLFACFRLYAVGREKRTVTFFFFFVSGEMRCCCFVGFLGGDCSWLEGELINVKVAVEKAL